MLQMVYCFTGIMYNVGSLLAQRSGQAAWAPTDAVIGGVGGMALYGLFLSTGLMKSPTLYRVLMGVCVALMGYGGVVVHLLNIGHMNLYQSVWTWEGGHRRQLLRRGAQPDGRFGPVLADGIGSDQ